MTRVLLVLLALVLSACRYESEADVTRGWVQQPLTALLPQGVHHFGTDQKDELIRIAVQSDRIEIRRNVGGAEADALTIRRVVGNPQMTGNVLIAVSETSGRFGYWPFILQEGTIWWHRPDDVTKVHTADQLAVNVRAGFQARDYRRLAPLAPVEALALDDRIRAARERNVVSTALTKASKEAGQRAASAAAQAPAQQLVLVPAQPAAPQKVNGYVVGDGVYVRGWLSDESGRIVEVDAAAGKAKVLRYRDGTTEWVEGGRLMSRQEATATNVARGAVAVGVMVCLLSPESCAPKR
jgi:hypothetical protein